MEAEKPITACVLIIGNEILSGRTQDVNLNYLAKGLNEAGVRLMEARVIPDIADAIVVAVNEVRAKYDYVLTTGGIGPTHDDITSECVARAFGVPLILHPEAARVLEASYRERGVEFNAWRKCRRARSSCATPSRSRRASASGTSTCSRACRR